MARRVKPIPDSVDSHAQYIRKNLAELNAIFAKAAVGIFDQDIKIPEVEDEFTELFVGVQIIIDVVREKIAEAERANTMLEQRIEERTRELQTSEAMLRSVMENTPSFIELLDRDLHITFINQTVEGTTRESVIGQHFSNFLDPKDTERIEPLLKKVLETGESAVYETNGPGDYQSRAYYHTTAGPIWEGEKIIGIALIASDITATKQIQIDLEQRSAELEVFNKMMVGRELKMVELKRKIERLNKEGDEDIDD